LAFKKNCCRTQLYNVRGVMYPRVCWNSKKRSSAGSNVCILWEIELTLALVSCWWIPQCEVTDDAISYCCSSLNGLPEWFMTLAVQSFVCCLREELKTTDVYLYRKVLDNLASCMEDFNLGMRNISNTLSSVLTCSALLCLGVAQPRQW